MAEGVRGLREHDHRPLRGVQTGDSWQARLCAPWRCSNICAACSMPSSSKRTLMLWRCALASCWMRASSWMIGRTQRRQARVPNHAIRQDLGLEQDRLRETEGGFQAVETQEHRNRRPARIHPAEARTDAQGERDAAPILPRASRASLMTTMQAAHRLTTTSRN